MSLTCVSCYYPVKNKYGNSYGEWFKTSLDIDCPYVVFSTKEGIEYIKPFRKDHPTYYIELDIEDFVTYKYKDRMKTDNTHCPSIELNLIWNEKIFMIKKAYQLNPFKSEWFKWIDAGICIYREVRPPEKKFPDENILNKLPKDKFIYSSSNNINPYMAQITPTNYYHHVCGTSYLLHIHIINDFAEIYEKYMDTFVNTNNIWTDQVVLTHIFKNNTTRFYKLVNGYGEVTRVLFG
uniref:Uncharacterized protein n=1 Tax=viral metagenome TaxID=1070528 RepID=A0A6C0JZN1_9ZZZZ